ncbi:MAG: cytidylate kinase-like family protein [Clostridiales bacterium]|nr:cytidylate kinase-like family protein [Clostridiales bacterium]
MEHFVVTIGREYGSGGRLGAEKLAQRLQVPFYDKKLILMTAKESSLSEEFIQQVESRRTNSFLYDLYLNTQQPPVQEQVFLVQRQIIQRAAQESSCVIVGRCGDYILRDLPECLKVFLYAPMEERCRRAREEYGHREKNIEQYIRKKDKERASHYNYYTLGQWGRRENYDMVLNSALGIDAIVEVIAAALRERENRESNGREERDESNYGK